MPPISRAWRAAVLERDEYTCRSCGAPAAVADHVLPRATHPHLAGDVSNGQALCAACHLSKTQAESIRWRR